MKHTLITLLTLTCTLAACAPVTAAVPTPTTSPTVTLAPTATTAPTPTATIAPDDIADYLGLRSTPGYENRTFTIEQRDGETFLVDQYNQAPKAVKSEDGSWRELDYTNPTDAEIMYGQMAKKGDVYMRTEEVLSDYDPATMLIYPVLLGDWEVGPVEYEGKQVSMYYLFGALRDGVGVLHVVRLAYDAPDTERKHMTSNYCKYDQGLLIPSSGDGIMKELNEQLKWLKPGETTGVDIWETSSIPNVDYWETPRFPLYNTMQFKLLTDLNNQHPDQYQLTEEERTNMKQLKWPDRLVTLALVRGPVVRRASKEACDE